MKRAYRLVEGTITVLFFLQGLRLISGLMLGISTLALRRGELNLTVVNAHLFLVGVLLVPWFSPRARRLLPEALSITAIVVALARVAVVLPSNTVRLYAGFAIIAFGGVYIASLLRANYRNWLTVIVAALCLDQLLRAYDTFDYLLQLSLRGYFDIQIDGVPWRVFWIVFQLAIAAALIVISRAARRSASSEEYRPAELTLPDGVGLGALLAIQMMVLAMPNVIARWTGVPVDAVVPWLLLATALPLSVQARGLIDRILGTFDEGVQGMIWLFIFLLLVVFGNRFVGIAAAGALIVAQYMAVALLWYTPSPPDPVEVDRVGPSLSIGLGVFFLLLYVYSFLLEPSLNFGPGLSVIAVVLTAVVAVLPRLFWQAEPPRRRTPVRLMPAFAAPVVLAGTLLIVVPAPTPAAPASTFRIATYNINGGYDEVGAYRLELTAQTIDASLADIVVLQEADAGRPVSFGADQVEFLARRLNMYHTYQPTNEQVQGVAILSRWPIFEPGGTLIQTPDGSGGVVTALIQNPVTGSLVTIYGAQLLPAEQTGRLEQYAILTTFIGETTPAVLAGDLAAPPEDAVYQQLTASGFVDPDVLLGVDQGFTTPASAPAVRHDYLLVRGLDPIDARQVNSTASDHRLVVIEVGWP